MSFNKIAIVCLVCGLFGATTEQIQATAKKDQYTVASPAVKALGNVGPEAIPALVEIAGDVTNLRMEVARAIQPMGPKAKAAVPVLAKALEEETHPQSLRTIVHALIRI